MPQTSNRFHFLEETINQRNESQEFNDFINESFDENTTSQVIKDTKTFNDVNPDEPKQISTLTYDKNNSLLDNKSDANYKPVDDPVHTQNEENDDAIMDAVEDNDTMNESLLDIVEGNDPKAMFTKEEEELMEAVQNNFQPITPSQEALLDEILDLEESSEMNEDFNLDEEVDDLDENCGSHGKTMNDCDNEHPSVDTGMIFNDDDVEIDIDTDDDDDEEDSGDMGDIEVDDDDSDDSITITTSDDDETDFEDDPDDDDDEDDISAFEGSDDDDDDEEDDDEDDDDIDESCGVKHESFSFDEEDDGDYGDANDVDDDSLDEDMDDLFEADDPKVDDPVEASGNDLLYTGEDDLNDDDFIDDGTPSFAPQTHNIVKHEDMSLDDGLDSILESEDPVDTEDELF